MITTKKGNSPESDDALWPDDTFEDDVNSFLENGWEFDFPNKIKSFADKDKTKKKKPSVD